MLTSFMLVAVALSAEPTADAELAKLKGSWTMVSGHVDGKAIAADHLKKNRITWDGKEVEIVSPHQSADPIKATMTKITPKGKGGEMEWKRSSGPGSGVTMLAIYEWDGPDSYKVA